MSRKGIDISCFSFESYRKKEFLYIDKTRYIWKLIQNGSAYFLARPRRFGKSLLLSTIEAFFLGKRELFNGLAIEQLAGENWDTYPVIHLVMSEIKGDDVAELDKSLKAYLVSKARELRVCIDTGCDAATQLRSLIEETCSSNGKKVVVLVDEYDKPILDVLHKDSQTRNNVLTYMRFIYQVIKNQNAKEHFVFVTGISKFSRVSLFSEMNNLIDITQSKEYSTMLGFTEEELDSYFKEDVQRAADKFGADTASMRAALKTWYDGFRFACCEDTVYNPVSIGNFFSNLEFRNFWYDTGTPSFLINAMTRTPFLLDELARTWMPFDQIVKYDIDNVSPQILAIQSGYMTIAEWKTAPDYTVACRYDFPNKEIRDSWNLGVLAVMVHVPEYEAGALVGSLKQSLADMDADAFMKTLERFFLANNYSNVGDVNEGFYRLMMQTLLSLVGVPVDAEASQAVGRCDLAAVYAGNAFVFEIKVCRKGDNSDKKLAEAVAQINEKHYEAKYSVFCKQVLPIALVFNDCTHTVEAWTTAVQQKTIATSLECRECKDYKKVEKQ